MKDSNLLEDIFNLSELKYFRDLYFVAKCKESMTKDPKTDTLGRQIHYPRIPILDKVSILSYVSGELGLSKNAGRITKAIKDLEQKLENEHDKISRYPTIKNEVNNSGSALFERHDDNREHRDYDKPTRLADLLNNAIDREDIYGDIQSEHDEYTKAIFSRQTGISDPGYWPLQLRFIFSPTLWNDTLNQWLRETLDKFPAASVVAWSNNQSLILEQLESGYPFRADLAFTYGAVTIAGYNNRRISPGLVSPYTSRHKQNDDNAADDIFVWVPHATHVDTKKNDLYPGHASILNPRAIFNTTSLAADFLQSHTHAVGYLPEDIQIRNPSRFYNLARAGNIRLGTKNQTLDDIDTSVYLHYREDIDDLLQSGEFENTDLYSELVGTDQETLREKLSDVPTESPEFEPSQLKQADLIFLAAATQHLLTLFEN